MAQLLNSRGTALITAMMAVYMLNACAAPTAENAYAEDFAQARELATTQFERDALADGQITREEYEEAIQRYVACMKDAGVTVGLEDQYGYYGYQVTQNLTRYDELSGQCSVGTKTLIEPLYVEPLTNPEKLHPDEATARCLVGVGLVKEPFGAEEFRQLLAVGGAETAEDQDPVPIDPKAVEIMSHEHFNACMANQQFHRTLNR